MPNKIVLIQSHCNTEEKKRLLKKNIIELKSLGLDVLLFSHIPLSEDIIESVDYFIYDKSNPIMWSERRHAYWKTINNIKLTHIVPEYGWTVYNQIIKSSEFALALDYSHYYIFCYDTIINETVKESLLNPLPAVSYKHKKPDGVEFDSALVFACFNKDNLSKIISLFNRQEYAEKYHLIAEDYFKEKLLQIEAIFSPSSVSDVFQESSSTFNMNYYNNDFKIFISNDYMFIYDIKNPRTIIHNEKLYKPSSQTLFPITKSNNLGFFIDEKYLDLTPSLRKLESRIIEIDG